MAVEVGQATGARARVVYNKETTWDVPVAAGSRELNIVAGESLDDQITLYRSKQIRDDRSRWKSRRGTRRPGGGLPLELAVRNMAYFFWHSLGSVSSVAGVAGLSAPTAPTVTPQGTTGAASYSYKITALNARGETIASAAGTTATGNATLSTANFNRVTWTSVGGSTGYRIYGRVGGSEALVGQVGAGVLQFDDTGLATPLTTIPAPTTNTTGTNIHTIKKASTLPTGFTLEKGFQDLATPKFLSFTGCRINGFTVDSSVDNMVDVNFDVVARSSAMSASSVFTNPVIEAPDTLPFTSVQILLQQNGTTLATAKNLQLRYGNGLYQDEFALGDNFRKSLKPGTVDCGGSALFMFEDTTLYQSAIDGTDVSLMLQATDEATDYVKFVMPVVNFLPNNSSPKIDSDGPLNLNLDFEALTDKVNGELYMIVQNGEAAINV